MVDACAEDLLALATRPGIDDALRRDAVWALESSTGPSGAPRGALLRALAALLDGADAEAQKFALYRVERLGPAGAPISASLARLSTRPGIDWLARRLAWERLAAMGPEVEPLLLATLQVVLDGDDREARREALHAAAELGARAAPLRANLERLAARRELGASYAARRALEAIDR